jgi:hypothetical protein
MLEDRDARRDQDMESSGWIVAYAHHDPKDLGELFVDKSVEKGHIVWWGKGPQEAARAVQEIFADDPDPDPSADPA